MRTVAALYVEPDGVYVPRLWGPHDVDPWPESRDARLYAGPHPVVAHPPCARWSVLAPLVEAVHGITGHDDGGCFVAALESVRRYGGVLEHPARSAAWPFHGLRSPARYGWRKADPWGWTAAVAQWHYGHRCTKWTWLYAVRTMLPMLPVGPGSAQVAVTRARGRGLPRARDGERKATPEPFRDLLLSMAQSV